MTPAQKNAKMAMQLYHSGKASSLKEAWKMVKRKSLIHAATLRNAKIALDTHLNGMCSLSL